MGTSKTMAKLDRSKPTSNSNQVDSMDISESSPALVEAKNVYLPTEDEVPAWEEEELLVDDDCDDKDASDNSSGWGSSLKGMMDQISGRVLTSQDLDDPLKEMEKMLTGK